MHSKPIIPQSDYTLMVHVDCENFQEVREFIAKFTVAVKTPEHIHIYKIDTVSLWNASVLGLTAEYILSGLREYCQFPVPKNVENFIHAQTERYGQIQFVKSKEESLFIIQFLDDHIYLEVTKLQKFGEFIREEYKEFSFSIHKAYRGKLKAYLIEVGYPVEDLLGYEPGDPLEVSFTSDWKLRPYQNDSVESFWAGGSDKGGAGVVVLACGGGKTLVAIGVIEKAQTKTLIVTTTANAVYQFRDEILKRTNLRADQVGVFTGKDKEIRDITITTYSMLTYREHNEGQAFKYIHIFEDNNWGLLIYDEVHTLPAPVFSFSTSLQATRRLGLTATLIREDGKENLIFGLIGPKRYDMPWKDLEEKSFIAKVVCKELRIPLAKSIEDDYYNADSVKTRFKIAASNPEKIRIVTELMEKHRDDKILIIGEYLDQLDQIHAITGIPLITGKIPPEKREELFGKFRTGEIRNLLLSRVANFAIDLPDANVLIQVSGLYGSRQEEAQRLGRVLRPKPGKNEATFYSLVTNHTVEVEYAEKRQLFLIEQGYAYDVEF